MSAARPLNELSLRGIVGAMRRWPPYRRHQALIYERGEAATLEGGMYYPS